MMGAGVDVEVRSAELGFTATARVPDSWIPTEAIGPTRAVVIEPDRWARAEFAPNLLMQVVEHAADESAAGVVVVSDRSVAAADGAERRVTTMLLQMLDVAVVEQVATVTVGDAVARMAVSASEAQWPHLANEIDEVVASLTLVRTVTS